MTERYAGSIPCGSCSAPLPLENDGISPCGCGTESRVLRFRPFRQVTAVALQAPASGTTCAYHAGNLAVVACVRCGSFLCELCATPLEKKTYCTACFERLRSAGAVATLKGQFPRPHVTALALAFLAMIPFAGLFILPFAIWQWIKAWRIRQEILAREGGVMGYLSAAAVLGFLAVLISLGSLIPILIRSR